MNPQAATGTDWLALGFLLFQWASVAWVYLDARKRPLRWLEPGSWALGTLLVWVVMFPLYLFSKLKSLDHVRIGVLALAVLLDLLGFFPTVRGYDVVGLVAAVVCGFPIYREAFEAVIERHMTMELSMTIALAAALSIGEVRTALVIALFVLIAEEIEDLTVDRGRRAIGHLLDLLPRTVTLLRQDREEAVETEAVRPGDVLLIRPGSRIPADGEVVAGASAVDQATITGESLPVDKFPGSAVLAGSINQTGALTIRVERVGAETAFGRIVHAVEEAERSAAPVQRLADRLAGWLVYFALGSALLTFLVTRDARSTISVVIVAGACGIAAGTPLAILGAIGRAAREGAIVKGGRYLEALSEVDTVVLDKTGTLTAGDPAVVAIVPAIGTERSLLEAAATAERLSEHPLGKAIVARAQAAGVAAVAPDDFAYRPGLGVVTRSGSEEILAGNGRLLASRGVQVPPATDGDAGVSTVHVGRSGAYLGAIRIADRLRPESEEAVRQLRERGLRVVLLTGDAEPVARAIADKLGITECLAEVLPEQKADYVRSQLALGRKVAMVGDGVNDAPALLAAHVGVAMGSGTDVARESADVALLGNDLGKVVKTLDVARRCRRIVIFNFAGTLAVDAVGIGLAALGLLNPMLAAFIHVASELAFIFNSARLLPAGRRPE